MSTFEPILVLPGIQIIETHDVPSVYAGTRSVLHLDHAQDRFRIAEIYPYDKAVPGQS